MDAIHAAQMQPPSLGELQPQSELDLSSLNPRKKLCFPPEDFEMEATSEVISLDGCSCNWLDKRLLMLATKVAWRISPFLAAPLSPLDALQRNESAQ